MQNNKRLFNFHGVRGAAFSEGKILLVVLVKNKFARFERNNDGIMAKLKIFPG